MPLEVQKENTPFNNNSQKEALINEVKGYIFEYLVGWNLALNLKIEGKFLRDITPYQRDRLREYQSWPSSHQPDLIPALSSLAKGTVKALLAREPLEGDSIIICGRRGHTSSPMDLGEADILLHQRGKNAVPIGLKLCKANSFVNTKSGGLLSFLAKYFGATSAQKRFNRILGQSFHQMAFELYEGVGLEYLGQWDSSWEEEGHSLLPGSLPPPLRKIVHSHYRRAITALYQEIKALWEKAPLPFVDHLFPLVGFKNRQLIQLICFYKGRYEPDKVIVNNGEKNNFSKDKIQLGPLNPSISSFEIIFPDKFLQIRVKPMNRFNTVAFKVNCSIKWKL